MRWNKEWGVMEYDLGDEVTIKDSAALYDLCREGFELGVHIVREMCELCDKKATISRISAIPFGGGHYAMRLKDTDWHWTSEMFIDKKKNKYCTRQMDAISILNAIKRNEGYVPSQNFERFLNAYRRFDFYGCRHISWLVYWNEFERRLLWNMLKCVRPDMENVISSTKVPLIDNYFIKYNGTH